MSRDAVVAKVQAQMWQTLASRGGIQSLPPNEIAILIEVVATGVAVAFEGYAETAVSPSMDIPVTSPIASSNEVVIWVGKPHMTAGTDALSTQYELTSQRIRVITGMVNRKTDEVELIRVKDIRVEQSLPDRGLGIGNVVITSTDASQPTVVFKKVANPSDIKEQMRRAVLTEKTRQGVSYRDMT